MKLKFLSLSLCALLSHNIFAATTPAKCPDAAAIQNVGITYTEHDDNSWYAGVLANDYATQDKWTFAMGEFKATDANDAKQQATDALAVLHFARGPVQTKINGKTVWLCLYNTKPGLRALTVTPAMGPSLHSLVIQS